MALALMLTALVLDWLQTRVIAKNPATMREINVILGEHPTLGRVNLYFATCCALAVPAWMFLGCWFFALTGIEVFVVWRNYRLGIRI